MSFLNSTRGAATKLILPPQSTWEGLWSAVRGAFGAASDPLSRAAFEELVERGVIQDSVLSNSPSGSFLIFGLFDQLHQNPLFAKHLGGADFAAEFTQALGPALTNFHDLLYQLQQKQEDSFMARQKEKGGSSSQEDDGAIIFQVHLALAGDLGLGISSNNDGENNGEENPLESLLGPQAWKQEAEKDRESLEAAFAQMITPEFFNSLYYSTELALLTRKHLEGMDVVSMALNDDGSDGNASTSQNDASLSTQQEQLQQQEQIMRQSYQPGTAKIGQVAVLRARAMELENERDGHQYREFDASNDPNFENKRVAAQWDVLFEVKSRFTETFSKPANRDGTNNTETQQDHVDEIRTEDVEYTRLGVAVLEGYLHRSPIDGNSLRWRVPLIRDPYEFDMTDPSTSVARNVLSSSTEPASQHDERQEDQR